eukprot:gene5379-6863_t
MASSSCRCLASFAAYPAVLVALLDLAAGVAAVQLQRLVLSYLSDHRDSLKLTDGDISVIRSWYVVIAIGFFASLVLEAMRVWFNAGFSDTARRIDNEFSALLTEEDRKWEESSSERAQMTSEKYSALRAYYKKKYSRENRPSEDQQPERLCTTSTVLSTAVCNCVTVGPTQSEAWRVKRGECSVAVLL